MCTFSLNQCNSICNTTDSTVIVANTIETNTQNHNDNEENEEEQTELSIANLVIVSAILFLVIFFGLSLCCIALGISTRSMRNRSKKPFENMGTNTNYDMYTTNSSQSSVVSVANVDHSKRKGSYMVNTSVNPNSGGYKNSMSRHSNNNNTISVFRKRPM